MEAVMDDEKIRRADALNEVLDRHLPGPWDPPPSIDGYAVVDKVLLDDPGTILGAIKPDKERDKLDKIRQLARELSKTLFELNEHTYWEILEQSQDLDVNYNWNLDWHLDDEDDEEFLAKFWCSFWSVTADFDELMEKITPGVKNFIDRAPTVGRNLGSVLAVDLLRKAWRERKKIDAPENITDTGKFADFLREALEAIGIDMDARSAMQSWRDFKTKYPESRMNFLYRAKYPKP
jgi:hypothetical protein